MTRSPGRRFMLVGFLSLLMFIPLFFAAEIIGSRKGYSQSTIQDVGREWGGPQTLAGPFLVIPVERKHTHIQTRPKVDPVSGLVMVDDETGKEIFERFEQEVTRQVEPVYLLPGAFDVRISTTTTTRSRGIFRVPVYTAQVGMGFDFDTGRADDMLAEGETLLWDKAWVELELTNNKALRGEAALKADGAALALQPMVGKHGFRAQTGDPRAITGFDLDLGLNGAQKLFVTPVGLQSRIEMTSDWPHPSFAGAFLPDSHEVSETGFAATWTIPHLARPLPQAGRDPVASDARRQAGFGVNLIQPNDFYQKSYRAANYGILFIALTFLTIVLIERGAARPVHGVQYILVGLTQSVFALLMVAYAEQIGFAAAYLLSSAAVIGLLTAYGAVGMKLGQRSWALGAVLVVVYAILYLILASEDYALLAGSTVAFLALALTMFATRNEDWFGPEKEAKPSMLARMLHGPTGQPNAAARPPAARGAGQPPKPANPTPPSDGQPPKA